MWNILKFYFFRINIVVLGWGDWIILYMYCYLNNKFGFLLGLNVGSDEEKVVLKVVCYVFWDLV